MHQLWLTVAAAKTWWIRARGVILNFIGSLKIFGTSYVAAKTKTEQAILEFAEKSGLEVVTLAPPLVVGGFICKNFPISVHLALAMILGMY